MSNFQDFESERKWKLAQAKKVALKASRGMLDHATKGEKKIKVNFFLPKLINSYRTCLIFLHIFSFSFASIKVYD